ncbi:MAG: hemerythrin domain-containing protein [Bacteroidota bacterium]|nr:hemerythrin domain-containing protein [Bacteroidota bacterium]
MKKIIRFGRDTKMADVIHSDYTLIPIITRFGIGFGFGDDTVETVCEAHAVNADFFLEIIRAFHDPYYKKDSEIEKFPPAVIIDYLLKSHRYYTDIKLRELDRRLEELSWKEETAKNNRRVLNNFFQEYKHEVLVHTQHEEDVVYPYILEVEQAFKLNAVSEELLSKIREYPIDSYVEEHSSLDSALLDLKNLLIKFLPSPDDQYAVNELLREVFSFEKDLQDHAELEEQFLVPRVKIMETKLLNKQ